MDEIPYIPFFTTSRYRVASMVELSDLPSPAAAMKRKMKGIDLGSGDGRIVIAFAKKGVEMHGFELDLDNVESSRRIIGYEHLTNAFIHQKDFWKEDLSTYDIVTMYPMPGMMELLETKFQKELKKGAKVLLNYYPFPHWKESIHKDNVYLYIK